MDLPRRVAMRIKNEFIREKLDIVSFVQVVLLLLDRLDLAACVPAACGYVMNVNMPSIPSIWW